MFDKIEYELLVLKYMPKDEYKTLMKKDMDDLNIPYITAKQYIYLKQMQQFEYEVYIGPSECGRDRQGFGWHAVSEKLRAIQYYRVLNIINLNLYYVL